MSSATGPTKSALAATLPPIRSYTAREDEAIQTTLSALYPNFPNEITPLILAYRGRYCWQEGELVLQAKQVRTYLTNAKLKGLDHLCDEALVYKVHRFIAERYLPILPLFGGIKGFLALPPFSSNGDNTVEFLNKTRKSKEWQDFKKQLYPSTTSNYCHMTQGFVTKVTLPPLKDQQKLFKELIPLHTETLEFIGMTVRDRGLTLDHIRIFRAGVPTLDSEETLCYTYAQATFSLVAYQFTKIFLRVSTPIEAVTYCTPMHRIMAKIKFPKIGIDSVIWVPGNGIIDRSHSTVSSSTATVTASSDE